MTILSPSVIDRIYFLALTCCAVALLGLPRPVGAETPADRPGDEEYQAHEEERPGSRKIDVEPGQRIDLFDGRSLDDWRIVDQFDFAGHGQVEVRDGAIILGRGRPGTAISYRHALPRVDYELTLEAKRIEGRDFFCGITFPVADDYLTLILGGWGGGVTGLSNLDDFSAIENENQWYQVRLRVTRDRVTAWLDDREIIDARLTNRKLSIWWEQEPVRPLGIASWYTQSALRNIRYQRLEQAGE